MSKTYKIFIPFIHEEYSEEMVRAKLSEYGLCKVVRIDMHEKKEKTNDGGLRSLNHSYAFVVVIPLDTFQGNQFLENLKTHKNTHMIHDNDSSKYWTIKPHLSMEERFDKGFSLLHEPIRKNANNLQIEKVIVTETEEEEEEEEPDWLHEPMNSLNFIGYSSITIVVKRLFGGST